MIDKTVESLAAALAGIEDGATVMIGGFGEAGSPIELIHALIDHGAKDLTVVNNNTGSGEVGLAALIKTGRVSRMICSYPRTTNSTVFPTPQPTYWSNLVSGAVTASRSCFPMFLHLSFGTMPHCESGHLPFLSALG